MSRTKQEQVSARDAAEAFRLLLPTLTTVETTDANGYPVVTVGSIAADGGGAYISFVPEVTVQTDALGIAQRVYAPHRVRVAIEAGAVTGQPDADMTAFSMLKIFQIVFKIGSKTEFWLETDGTGPSATTFDTASKLQGSFYPDSYNPLRSQM